MFPFSACVLPHTNSRFVNQLSIVFFCVRLNYTLAAARKCV